MVKCNQMQSYIEFKLSHTMPCYVTRFCLYLDIKKHILIQNDLNVFTTINFLNNLRSSKSFLVMKYISKKIDQLSNTLSQI